MKIRLEETESTNTYAKTHIKDLDDRTIVHALRQTHGRGRLNRSWVDLGNGNLFFTLVLKPSDKYLPIYSNLTQYTSLVLCEIFEEYGLNAKIKWPNDVMIDGERKISGILCETVMEGQTLDGIIIGVGVNLNASIEDVESIPDRKVTSLNLEINKVVDMDEFLDKFINKFFNGYDSFLMNGFSSFREDYVAKNCFLNKVINVQVLNDIKSGVAKRITETGELIIETNDKQELELTIGDIL